MTINGTTSSTIISLDQTMSIISISFANVIIYLLISTSDKIKGSRQERCWSVTQQFSTFFPYDTQWVPKGYHKDFIYIYIYDNFCSFYSVKPLGAYIMGMGPMLRPRAQLGLTGPYSC